uniref:Uncharacterized protein n=1 Tax=Spironucleus salmonicida TaxID=348837 RepID=V6LLL0_9EUKA|eukprot:EST45565.1 Hypothetical protein SS50377_14495 [Spironucleus salmonicida]
MPLFGGIIRQIMNLKAISGCKEAPTNTFERINLYKPGFWIHVSTQSNGNFSLRNKANREQQTVAFEPCSFREIWLQSYRIHWSKVHRGNPSFPNQIYSRGYQMERNSEICSALFDISLKARAARQEPVDAQSARPPKCTCGPQSDRQRQNPGFHVLPRRLPVHVDHLLRRVPECSLPLTAAAPEINTFAEKCRTQRPLVTVEIVYPLPVSVH